METERRIFGLDILRSLAIVIVVIKHSNFIINSYLKNYLFIYLPDGVDLFFVLSGYLIGTIIIKTAEHNQKFNLTIVLNFLQRRWFRTLPNYFLFLLINIVLIYFGLINGFLNKYLITFFFFFQNFHIPYDFLYWESWSLSVEEWFYFTFPVILLMIFGITKSHMKIKYSILITIIVFLFFPLIYRITQSSTFNDFDLYFRKLVLTRLDTIGFGLVGAYINWYYNAFWKKSKNILFIIGILLLTLPLIINIEHHLYFYKTFYFSFIGLSILLILPKLENIKNENIPLKPFRFISKISYSMYLIHLPLLQIISKMLIVSSKMESILVYISFWLTTLILSYFTYTVYEKPMMNIRENILLT